MKQDKPSLQSRIYSMTKAHDSSFYRTMTHTDEPTSSSALGAESIRNVSRNLAAVRSVDDGAEGKKT